MTKDQANFWIPNPEELEKDKNCTKTCLVTIASACLLTDQELDLLVKWIEGTHFNPEEKLVSFMESYDFPVPDDDHPKKKYWGNITTLKFHCWADGRFISEICFGGDPGQQNYSARYVDGTMILRGSVSNDGSTAATIPNSVIISASGNDMTKLLPHPVFHGLRWQYNQKPEMDVFGKPKETHRFLYGPEVDILLGKENGTRFKELVLARRRTFDQEYVKLKQAQDGLKL